MLDDMGVVVRVVAVIATVVVLEACSDDTPATIATIVRIKGGPL